MNKYHAVVPLRMVCEIKAENAFDAKEMVIVMPVYLEDWRAEKWNTKGTLKAYIECDSLDGVEVTQHD